MSKYCPFCKKNGEIESFWRSHGLRDENNEVVCPVLKKFTCPICERTGHHTASYCPRNSLNGSKNKKTGFSPKRQTTSGRPTNIQALKPSRQHINNQQQTKISDENNNSITIISNENGNNNKVANMNKGLDCKEQVIKLNFNALPPFFVGDRKQDLMLYKQALISAQVVQPPEKRINYLIERGYNPARIDYVRQAAYIVNYTMIQMGILY